MTACCIGIPVIAGPIEATALGNILIQLVALGELENIHQGRQMLAATETVTRYEPQEHNSWNESYRFYQKLLSKNQGGI